MSIYNKPDLKINIGCNTPSFHKKLNSLNFSASNTGRNQLDNTNKVYLKNRFDVKYNTNSNLNTESNAINYNNQIIPNAGINKVLTSANLKNRRIEIDLNQNNSPNCSQFNKSMGDNTLLFKHRQCPSQNNINNRIINYNIINSKDTNHHKNKNSLNNINININISKKIISTYYNKSKDKKNLIVKKKSINSLNNSNKKHKNNNKYSEINHKEEISQHNNINVNMKKNQSEINFVKMKNNDSNLNNYYTNQMKTSVNTNSITFLSTNGSIPKNPNKNNVLNNNYINNSNIYANNNPNYTNTEIYNNYYSNRDNIINKKSYGNIFNKIIKENKASFPSEIQAPMSPAYTQSNINSIQNYLKYLNIGQKNKNCKNLGTFSKNKAHKLSANNVNYNHNITESNIYNKQCNSTYNYDIQNTFTQNNYTKYNDEKENIIPNLKKNRKIFSKSTNKIEIKNIDDVQIESPEELHYYYVTILQKGKKINFEHKNNK